MIREFFFFFFILLVSCISYLLFLIYLAQSCEEGTFELTVIKRYTYYSQEETVEVYSGNSPDGQQILTFTGVSSEQHTTKTYTVCTIEGPHYIRLVDSWGDGWGNSNREAGVWVYRDNVLLVSGVLPYASGRENTEKTIPFDTTLLRSSTSDWYYTDSVQSTTEWTNSVYEPTGWSQGHSGSFTSFTTTTRYYRSAAPVTNYGSYESMALFVVAKYGYRVYINGRIVTTYNLPTTVTSTTQATESRSGTSKIVIPKYYLPTSGGVVIALEVHRPSGDDSIDSFNTIANFRFVNADDRTPDVFGILSGSAVCNPTIDTCDSIFDNDLSSRANFGEFSGSATVTYTFPDHNQEWINYYMVYTSSSSNPPRAWKLYGSNDGSEWTLLDSKRNVIFSSGGNYYSLPASLHPYNQLKIEVTESSSSNLSFGSFRAFRHNVPPPTSGLIYEDTQISAIVGFGTVNLAVISSGYTGFTVSPSMPPGLTLGEDGLISGSPTAPSTTPITISAINADSVTETVTLTVNIRHCGFPDTIHIRLTKHLSEHYNTESFTVVNSSTDEQVYSSSPYTSSEPIITDLCLNVGTYEFTLYTTRGTSGWSKGSNILIQVVLDENQIYTHASLTLLNTDEQYYSLNLSPYSTMDTTQWRIYQGIPTSNWYETAYPASEFTLYNTNEALTSTSNCWFFRTTINFSTSSNWGIQIQIYARAGILVYLNDELIYRRYLSNPTITSATIPTDGVDTPEFIAIDSLSDSWNIGTNTLSIALIQINGNVPTNVDAVFYLQQISTFTQHITNIWDASFGGTYNTNTDFLFDNNYDNEWQSNPPYKDPVEVYVNFGSRHAFNFNQYCLTSALSDYPSDPSDWVLYGAFSDEIYEYVTNATNAYFADRMTTRCFVVPNIKRVYQYYKIIFTENAVPTPESLYKYRLLEISFRQRSFRNIVGASLRIIPNTAVGIVGTPFPTIRSSNELFSGFGISPALPAPLEIDTTTAAIRGIPTTTMPTTQYTISAMHPQGRIVTTMVTLSVEDCLYPNVLIDIQIQGDSKGEEQGYELRDLDGVLIASTQGVIDSQMNHYPSCVPANLYYLTLTDTGGDGWTTGYCRITQNGDVIFRGSLAGFESQRTFPLSLGYVIEPIRSTWKVAEANTVTSTSWNSISFDASSWNSYIISQLPTFQMITQYLRYEFTIEDITKYAAAEIRVKTHVGIIVYINGVELFRRNMPNGDITSSMECLVYNTDLKTYIVSFNPRTHQFTSNINVLAIEVHQKSPTFTSELDAQLSVFGDGSWRNYDVALTATNPAEPLDYIADNNPYTVYRAGPACVGQSITFNYGDRQEFINAYSLSTTHYCNDRHPSGWTLEGSRDGQSWTPLHVVMDQISTKYNNVINFTFYNEQTYNQFRFTVTECENPRLSGVEDDGACLFGNTDQRGLQIADISLYSSFVDKSCEASDGYPDAANNQAVYRDCPEYYSGIVAAFCVQGQFINEVRSCDLLIPRRVSYESSSYSFSKGDSVHIQGTVEGAEVECTITPNLPEGLIFDTETASITGSPSSTSNGEYRVSCTNAAGSSPITTISINVSDPALIAIIIAVVVIIIIIIVVIIVICFVRRPKAPKKSNSSSSSGKTRV